MQIKIPERGFFCSPAGLPAVVGEAKKQIEK
jgi:hypothetical protein